MSDRLDTYRRKRDFGRTPEPAGDPVGETDERRFVVQRHRASRLHYDFRLEIDGVLVSWAVPKGPTLDPKVRRGAFRTEDHPIDYLLFEGVIPSREYGGGDVIVWDTGTWQPDEKKPDASRDLARGELHVDLFGTKLRGRFILIRTSPPDIEKQQWLLLHKHDDFAVTGYDAEDHPKSAISGRTNDEVRADPDRLWRSDLPAERASIALKPDALSGEELAEFDSFGAGGTWHVYNRTIRLGNLDRELVGGRSPVTKRDLVRYAARIAPVAVPYLERRSFDVSAGRAPDWIERRDGHLVLSEAAALIWAVNFGTVEWQIDASPAFAVIELDPPSRVRRADMLVVARLYRAALEHLGVTARPMLTGAHALSIWVPTDGRASDDWTATLIDTVAEVVPDEISRVWQVDKSAGPVLAPYSPRALPRAPVAAPLEWDELDDASLRSGQWTIRTVLDRLAERPDPFRAIALNKQRLPRWE